MIGEIRISNPANNFGLISQLCLPAEADRSKPAFIDLLLVRYQARCTGLSKIQDRAHHKPDIANYMDTTSVRK
jgi:hypothetical protein